MMRALLTRLTITICLFATGATGLIYEVVWQRYLAQLLGNDHTATAVTLAIFLAGLSLGYALCGRLTTRVRDHLKVYALLEGAIGAWALLFPWLFSLVEGLAGSWSFRPPWLLVTQGVVVASVLLLPPAMMMGATVPFLTRIAASTEGTLTAVHAQVYAVNTGGAFVGARSLAWGGPEAERSAQPIFSTTLLCWIVALSGLQTMVLENALFRCGSIVFGGSTVIFSVVVAVFVAAIAVGGAIVARRRQFPASMLSVQQLLVAVSLVDGGLRMSRCGYSYPQPGNQCHGQWLCDDCPDHLPMLLPTSETHLCQRRIPRDSAATDWGESGASL